MSSVNWIYDCALQIAELQSQVLDHQEGYFTPQFAIRNWIDLANGMGYDDLINKKRKLDLKLYMRRIVGSVSRIIKASPPAG